MVNIPQTITYMRFGLCIIVVQLDELSNSLSIYQAADTLLPLVRPTRDPSFQGKSRNIPRRVVLLMEPGDSNSESLVIETAEVS